MPKHQELLQEFQALALSADDPRSLMERMTLRIHRELTRYSWIGFFLLSPDSSNLLLGPYAGSLSPQASISIDEGLCGAAIRTARTIVVDDVSNDPRYAAVMQLTRSEIVVPIFVYKKVIGEIDVNSYFLKTFTEPERVFVESCAAIVGRYFEARGCTNQDVVSHSTASHH